MSGLADFFDDLLGAADLVALSLVLGGVVWGLIVLRAWKRLAPAAAVPPCTKLILAGAVGVAVAQLSELVVKAWILALTLGEAPFPAFFHAGLFRARLSRALIAAGLGVAAAYLRRRPQSARYWAGVGFLALLLAVSGAWLTHAAGRLEDSRNLMVLTTLHETSATAWAGGIVQLLVFWRLRRREPGIDALWPVVLRRFSFLAAAAVLVLLASGGALAWSYVGSWIGFAGTGYGVLLLVKAALLCATLGLAAMNFRAVHGRSGSDFSTELRTRVPCFIEGEAFLLLALLFAAAALSSQPPAVDTRAETVSWPEVIQVFTPKMPRVTSPTHATLLARRAAAASAGDPDPIDDAWSEFNHNVAGLFLLVMSLLALLDQTKRFPLARHWSLGFVALAVLLFFRNDPGSWPLGPESFWSGMLDAEVLQHRVATVLAAALGLLEWRARSARAASSRLPYFFPALSLTGGVLLLTHSHTPFELKHDFLIQISHTTMGLFAVFVGCARWLELRLPARGQRLAGVGAVAAMLSIGAILMFYREPP